MKSIAIMQPYFFPYLGYFQLINKVDNFLLYPYVGFRRRSYMTKNYLVTNNREIDPIFIKTKKEPLGTNIINIRTLDHNCKIVLLKKIKNIYSRTPYYNEVINKLEPLVKYESESLMGYNSFTLKGICDMLDIKTEFLDWKSSSKDFEKIEINIRKKNENDTIKLSSKRIIELCKYFNTDTYINPEGGTEIYDSYTFSQNGINLKFNKPNLSLHHYGQEATERYRYTSIIDVVMINGINRTKELVKLGHLFN